MMLSDRALNIAKSKIDQGTGRWKKILSIFMIFLVIHGTIGFTMFILEEGMQTMMFTAFSYRNAKDYSGLQEHARVMKAHHDFSAAFIKYVGWLAPLMYPAYLKYIDSNEAYIKGIENECKIKLSLSPAELEQRENEKWRKDPATRKQVYYIRELAKKQGNEIQEIGEISKGDASDCIEFLKEGRGSCVLL